MCLQNVLSIVGFVAALCTYLAFFKAWFSDWRPGYLTICLALRACKFESVTWLPALPVWSHVPELWATADSSNRDKCFKSISSPQLSDLARSHVVTCDKQKQEQKEGNSMLAHILSFFLRKIHPASLSIMQEHNFEHNARILGLTLKSIMLKFSSIIYLTLTSRG